MARRRYAVDADRHAASRCDLRADFGAGEHAAVAGLGALAELKLDHLDLVALRAGLEFLGAERTVRVAAREIAGADFPDDVAAVFAVIGAVTTLAGIMREVAFLCAAVKRENSVLA